MIEEESFIRAIQENPKDPAPRLIYADWLEEQNRSIDAERLRLAAQIHTALTNPDTLTDADMQREKHIADQYRFQEVLLQSIGLLEYKENIPGVTINETFHPMPTLSDVLDRVRTPFFRKKMKQGFNQLLLVPLGLPLDKFFDAYRQGLVRNERLTDEQLNRKFPLWASPSYQNESLIYFPDSFDDNHGGLTKAQLPPWQVLLIEDNLSDLPYPETGKIIQGRYQIENGRSPRQYLSSLQGRKEKGLTPESYIIAHLTHLEQTGILFEKEAWCYLINTYFPFTHDVPEAFWDEYNDRSILGVHDPAHPSPSGGMRAAIQVM